MQDVVERQPLFCYRGPTEIPIDGNTLSALNWMTRSDDDFGSGCFAMDLARRLKKQLADLGQIDKVILNPADIPQIIYEVRNYLHEESSGLNSWGTFLDYLYRCIERNMVVDLRTVTWNELKTLGEIPAYRWKNKADPNYPNNDPWPCVKLDIGVNLIMWDGRKTQATWGDYIVMVQENPPTFGRVGYIAHELQGSLETV